MGGRVGVGLSVRVSGGHQTAEPRFGCTMSGWPTGPLMWVRAIGLGSGLGLGLGIGLRIG